MSELTPPPALLRNRSFLWLWGGDAVSQVGTQLTHLAIPVIAVANSEPQPSVLPSTSSSPGDPA